MFLFGKDLDISYFCGLISISYMNTKNIKVEYKSTQLNFYHVLNGWIPKITEGIFEK